jgi:hypothetical protein
MAIINGIRNYNTVGQSKLLCIQRRNTNKKAQNWTLFEEQLGYLADDFDAQQTFQL